MITNSSEKPPIPKAYFAGDARGAQHAGHLGVQNMVVTPHSIARIRETPIWWRASPTAPVFTAMIAPGDIFGPGSSSVILALVRPTPVRRRQATQRVPLLCRHHPTGLLILVLGPGSVTDAQVLGAN